MSRNPTSRKTQDHHRHRRGELIAGSAGDLHMKTIERTASAQSASRRKPLTVDEDQRLEKQERCRNPLSTLWLEDQECYQALEWVLRQVPHSESEHMTQDDIGEVLASWLWASSRETTNDRLPSVGTLIDAANQSTAFSEVMSADSEDSGLLEVDSGATADGIYTTEYGDYPVFRGSGPTRANVQARPANKKQVNKNGVSTFEKKRNFGVRN